jgi:hypothetical protein
MNLNASNRCLKGANSPTPGRPALLAAITSKQHLHHCCTMLCPGSLLSNTFSTRDVSMHEGVTTASKKERSGGTGPETPMTRRLISIFGLVCLYDKQNCYVAQAQSGSIDMKLAVSRESAGSALRFLLWTISGGRNGHKHFHSVLAYSYFQMENEERYQSPYLCPTLC